MFQQDFLENVKVFSARVLATCLLSWMPDYAGNIKNGGNRWKLDYHEQLTGVKGFKFLCGHCFMKWK